MLHTGEDDAMHGVSGAEDPAGAATPDFAAVFAALPGPAAVFAADPPTFTVLAANDALLATVGRARAAVVGRPLAEVFPDPDGPARGDGPSPLAALRDSLATAVRGGRPQLMPRQRYDVRGPDGRWATRYWDARNTPVRDAAGRVRCVLHQTEEVTALVHREATAARAERDTRAALRASEARRQTSEQWLRSALAATRMGPFDYDPGTDRLELTDASRDVFGLRPDEPLPASGAELTVIHPDDRARYEAAFRDAVGGRRDYELEYRVVRPRDGELAWIEERGSAVVDGGTGAVRVRGIHWDVSDRVRAREALAAEHARAEEANRAKGQFLATMSHELRTPLNAIGGYAELLELGIHGPVTAEQRQALARIQQSQRHLLGLINQVLNYTRVDAGAVHYALRRVAVCDALGAAEALVLPQLRARGLAYEWASCAPDLAVCADGEKLQQILLNLLSNAIKFTEPPGTVRVACAEQPDRVAVFVADTGIGIPPEKLASVFEPFVQVDQGLTRTREGVGLGLAISRDLARGMSGDLTVESTPGAGSTFTLTLPRA